MTAYSPPGIFVATELGDVCVPCGPPLAARLRAANCESAGLKTAHVRNPALLCVGEMMISSMRTARPS